MVNLSTYLRTVLESNNDLDQIKDLLDQIFNSKPSISVRDFSRIQSDILSWCEKNATELDKFTVRDTKSHQGIVIIDTGMKTFFPLLAQCSDGPCLWVYDDSDDRDLNIEYHPDGFNFSRLGYNDINRSDDVRVFAIDDSRFNAILNKRLSRTSGSSSDKYVGILNSEFDLKKAEVPANKYDFATLQAVETIEVDSMDDTAIAAKFANMMLKGKENSELVLGVSKNDVVFVLTHWGGTIQSGRYYEKDTRMANAFKTSKKFKEFFNKSNLKSIGVDELRIYKPNK